MKREKITDITVFIILVLFGVVLCFVQGQDANYDLANYHYYGVWALLNGRIGNDIMPCGIQSYFNPLYDFPLYFLVKYFNNNPYVIEFFQSLWYGVSAFGIYKIACLVFNGKNRLLYIILSVLIGITGALSVLEVGLSFNDLIITAFIIYAVYLYLKFYYLVSDNKSQNILLLSSFLLGIATGFKFSGFIFVIPLFIIHCVYLIRDKEIDGLTRTKHIIYPILGFFIGFSITGLWWYLLIWNKFGNPFFPLMNDIFKSPLAFEQNYADIRHLPKNIWQYLFYPFYWIINPDKLYTIEWVNRDFRFVFVYIFSLIVLFKYVLFNRKREIDNIEINIRAFVFLFLFVILSYIFWINNSSILRYIVLLELLSGIFIIASILYLSNIILKSGHEKIIQGVCIVITIILLISTQYVEPVFSRVRIPFQKQFIDFQNLNLPDNSVVLGLGGFSPNIIVPFQNKNIKFIFLYGEIQGYNFIYPKNEEEKIKEIINDKEKNKYLLYSDCAGIDIDWDYIKEFVDVNNFDCSDIKSNWNAGYKICAEKDKK